MVNLGQKKFLTLGPTPKSQLYVFYRPESDYQDKIFFSLKVLLLYTVRKYMKNETKFHKRPQVENELAASYET